jgi:hypothetical protein
MEPEDSIPNSQELSTCSYPKPDQSSPHQPLPTSPRSILILSTHLHLGLPSAFSFWLSHIYVYIYIVRTHPRLDSNKRLRCSEALNSKSFLEPPHKHIYTFIYLSPILGFHPTRHLNPSLALRCPHSNACLVLSLLDCTDFQPTILMLPTLYLGIIQMLLNSGFLCCNWKCYRLLLQLCYFLSRLTLPRLVEIIFLIHHTLFVTDALHTFITGVKAEIFFS